MIPRPDILIAVLIFGIVHSLLVVLAIKVIVGLLPLYFLNGFPALWMGVGLVGVGGLFLLVEVDFVFGEIPQILVGLADGDEFLFQVLLVLRRSLTGRSACRIRMIFFGHDEIFFFNFRFRCRSIKLEHS